MYCTVAESMLEIIRHDFYEMHSTYIYIYIYIYICVSIWYIYIYTYIHTYMYIRPGLHLIFRGGKYMHPDAKQCRELRICKVIASMNITDLSRAKSGILCCMGASNLKNNSLKIIIFNFPIAHAEIWIMYIYIYYI